MAKSPKNNENRLENILAYMTVGVVGLSLLTIITVLVAYFAGFHDLPPLLALIPLFGLPTGMLLIISLVIIGAVRRKRSK
jgi:cytochrome c-type biogenesis protein CcmH/NrfF